MAGEQNIGSQSGAPKGYIGDTRGQQFINSDPNYWINTLIRNNPTLKADPYLVTSLTQQFKDSTNPAQLAHSTLMAKYLNGTADQIGLSSLYPTPDTIYDAPAYRAPDKAWQRANSTGNWFSQLLQPVGNVLGSAVGGFIGAVSTPEAGKQVGNFWRTAPSDIAGGLVTNVAKLGITSNRVVTGNLNALNAGKGGLPAWQWQDPLYLGQAIHQTLSDVGKLPFIADTYMTNLKSQINKNGIGTAFAQQYANLLGGYLMGGVFGAAGGEGATVLDGAAEVGATASAQDAQIIESLTQKLKTEGSLSAEEQAALEKTKQDLLSRDPNALHKSAYQSGINEFKTQYPIEHGILEQDLARGSITQQEYDQAIAKGISGESQPAFNAASEAINSEQATTSAAQDAIQASKLNASDATFRKVAELATYPAAITLKSLGSIIRTLGSTPAQITYLLGALQAQNNPEDAYIWQLAEQGKVLNADGTTQDLGIEIANSLGIDGMWGTSVRDLVDVGLKWIVDDPIAGFARIVKESRGAYGMTGVLNKWFSGTGIREIGDVERAYGQYSSVRRAVSWIATHGAAAINQRFGALFLGSKLIEKLAAAKTDAQVLSVLEEASQAINMVDRITTMPSMGWYTYVKTGLTGEVGKEFSTVADALASPVMPTDKIIEAIQKETGIDITPHDVGYSAGGVAERAKILLSQRLRRQFSMKQMIIEGGRISDRQLVVGSVRSAEGIRKFLVNNFMSHDFANMVTDQLIRYGDDPVKWNNIYNNAMRLSLYRRMLASSAHSDFGIFADVMGPEIDDKIYQYTGVTGGGTSLDEAFIADTNTASDRTIDPETGKLTVAAADDKQLGRRMLPTERDMRMLSREIAKVAQNINKSGADDFLRSAEKDFEVVRQLAHTANVEAETYLKNFVPEDRSVEFAGKDSENGYLAKSNEILNSAKKMLESELLKSMTKAERYATVVKYLDGELIKARDAYVTASKKFDELSMMKVEPDKLAQTFGTTNVLPFLQHLRGEMLAVQDLGAEMKAAITSSYSSEENIAKQANYIASTASTKEAGEEYKRLFNEEWSTRSSRQIGQKLGIGKLNAANAYELWAKNTGIKLKSLGDRGMRNNFDVAVDLMQGYLNGWFKVLTLASPAWAERVIISEVMLNSLRIGGHNFTEAKLAQSIARHELYLGKVAANDVERKALRSAISNIILGFDTALAKTLVGKKFDDFLDFATNIYLETDGHMLGGVHSQGDLMSEDGFKHNVVNQVVGIEGKGAEAKIKTSNKILGPDFTKYMAGDSYAGAALYENITRASRGIIFKENNRWYEEKITEAGQRIFDSNPEFYMEQAKEDATKVLKDLGKELTDNNFKVQLKKSLDIKIRELGGRSLSNPSELARLRRESDYHMEGFISSQPAAWRADFRRDREPSAKYPNESPHTGWAKTSTDHTMGLSTDINSASGVANVIHPEIIHQIASGDFWSQEQLATWMREHWEKNDAPSAFPAHEYVGLMSAGNLNIARKFSDWLHRALLGKMVNTASRDPIFMWEAWQQYQKLLPLVEKGYMTMSEAMAKSQSEALINMSKFVHNPLDKTMWEENMRVVAPYYFAKNQAMRRALRMAGDNFAAFEKYMKINLAVTDYVALAYNQSGIGSFTFPGSQLITGFTNGIVNSILAAQGLPNYGAGKHMGLESSPASPDSIIITGQTPGIGGFLENAISMPFGPIITIPAKYVYEQMQYRIPFIGEIIKWVIGPNSMRSSIASDLFPNSTIQNVYKGVYGHMNQNQVGSYLSSELYSIGNEGSNILTKYRNETIDSLLKKGQINKQNINSGAAQQLINYYTARKVSLFLENPNNRTDLQSEANWATTALYASKTLTSLATPLSSVIASDTHVQKQLDAIALEKDKNGDFKFPSYTLQVAELLRKFPTELFNTVAHTKSPFSTYLETVGTVKYVQDHPEMVKNNPYLSAFLSSQQGTDSKYDPVASQLLGEFALRQKETPTEYMQAMRVALGNYMYYDVMLPGFKDLYPGTYANGLSSAGYYAWAAAGKAYGQSTNSAWLSEHMGGNSKNVASQAYTELQSFMKNSSYVATLTPAQKQYIPLLVTARSEWEKEYASAAGNTSEQSRLRAQWYNNCTTAITLPGWKDISTIITGVFRNLPAPS